MTPTYRKIRTVSFISPLKIAKATPSFASRYAQYFIAVC